MEMTMWHLQVHQCEDRLQELEMSSQQLLQASAEQVSFSLCMHFWLYPVWHTLLAGSGVLLPSFSQSLFHSFPACLLVWHPQAQSPQLGSSVNLMLIKKPHMIGWCCMLLG